ncbi:MAG: hypothetical protein ACRDEA_18780, partial [Microcystaceae cyanobacterium]
YGVTVEKTGNATGFDVFSMTNVQDISVELETYAGSGAYSTLTFGVGWFKRPNGTIYLYENPGSSRSLRIRQRMPATDSTQGKDFYNTTSALTFTDSTVVFVDNVFNAYSDKFTTTATSTYQITFTTAPITGAVIEYGRAYHAIYSSPLLTLGNISNYKKPRFVYAYFDNLASQETFKPSDLNIATSPTQDPDTIVGFAKQRSNASVALMYESDPSVEVEYDIYGFENFVFDLSLLDIYRNPNEFRRFAMFKEYLAGVGYGHQLLVFSFDETTFALSGYQITANPYAERYKSWSQ